MAKGVNQEKKPKYPKDDFLEAHIEVNYIYGGPKSNESRRKPKLIAQAVMEFSPATPEYLKWLEVCITFDRRDHQDFVPKPGGILLQSATTSRMPNSTGSSLMKAAP
jgi:hypothetical protein